MNGAKLRYSQHDSEDRRSLTVAHLRVGIFFPVGAGETTGAIFDLQLC